jgi:hypothetical protein
LILGYDYKFKKGMFIDHRHVSAIVPMKSYALVYVDCGIVIRCDDVDAAFHKGVQ